MWNDVVKNLERSVEVHLLSDDPQLVSSSIRTLRQFAVASYLNKAVVGNSKVLKPCLLSLLERFQWLSSGQPEVCIELCGLINSLVRDCDSLAESILTNEKITEQILAALLNSDTTPPRLLESAVLLLRSLFKAYELSSTLSKSPSTFIRCEAAHKLFHQSTLSVLLGLLGRAGNDSTALISAWLPLALTDNAQCYLFELLSLLSTDRELAYCLHQVGAVAVCHSAIMKTCCTHSTIGTLKYPPKTGDRMACLQVTNPRTQLAARFALKLLVHLFFHIDDTLKTFQSVYKEGSSSKLIACYGHLTDTIPTLVLGARHRSPSGPSIKNTASACPDQTPYIASRTNGHRLYSSQCPHTTMSVSSCAPSELGTQALIGILRGLIYWKLTCRTTEYRPVSAVDQFGSHLTVTHGIGVTEDTIALMIIQPLTAACLCVEDTRILAWICHALVLVLGKRPDLHLCTVYTNSFVREMDSRITGLIKASWNVSEYRSNVQLLDHVVPIIKLFACLASSSESVRGIISELNVCEKLIDFTIRLKPPGLEHRESVLNFQSSVCLLLYSLTRSFRVHYILFRREAVCQYILSIVDEHLDAACRGDQSSADIAVSASGCLANLALPMSPLRQDFLPLLETYKKIIIRLIIANKAPVEEMRSVSGSSEFRSSCSTDTDGNVIRPSMDLLKSLDRLRLHGVWGLANLLFGADAETCLKLFDHLVANDVWLELLRPPVASHVSCPSADRDTKPALQLNRRGSTSITVLSGVSLGSSPLDTPPTNTDLHGHSDSDLFYLADSKRTPLNTPLLGLNAACASGGISTTPMQLNSTDQKTNARILTLYQTLSVLRNLLRDEKVVTCVMQEHWGNIAQLIVSALEGDYPQLLKQQAIMVLANLANVKAAREQLYRNEDLVEKLNLFMRSSDSYTKASALIATYNLLDASILRHRYRRHPEGHRNPSEAVTTSSTSSAAPGSLRREIATCVAQSALQEAEEEEEEEDAEETEVNVAGGLAHYSDDPEVSTMSPPQSTSMTTVEMLHEGSANSASETILVQQPQRQRRVYRTRLQAPSSGDEMTDHGNESDDKDPTGHIRSVSASSSSSTSSTHSYAEDDLSISTQLADLDRSTAQELCVISSPSCSEGEFIVTPVDAAEGNDHLVDTESHYVVGRAPLADQERMEDTESVTDNIVCDAVTELTDAHIPLAEQILQPARDTCVNTVLLSPPHSNVKCDTTTASSSSHRACKNSHKTWEEGFQKMLLPFLQELSRDQILRSTWDWLILRAHMVDKSVFLHTLLNAWSRLYGTISSGLPGNFTDSDISESFTPNSSIDVSVFLEKLYESPASLSSTSLLVAFTRYRDGRMRCYHHHHDRHHHRHRCRRHRNRSETRRSLVPSDSTSSLQVVSVTSTAQLPLTSLEPQVNNEETSVEQTDPHSPSA